MEQARMKTTLDNIDHNVISFSGGKDSTFQALTIRELGFNPLLVTATTIVQSAVLNSSVPYDPRALTPVGLAAEAV